MRRGCSVQRELRLNFSLASFRQPEAVFGRINCSSDYFRLRNCIVMRLSPLHISTLLLGCWFLLTNHRDPNNPPVARTGAPGETTCGASGCHAGGAFTGTVAITGIPDTVTANQSYTVTLTNTSNAVRAGFQLTCLDGANAYSGTLTNGTGTSIGTSNSTGRKYIRQSSAKTLSGGSAGWTFTWKAPATAAEDKCTFYFVSLCANGNGNNSGDNVLVSNKSVVLRSVSAAGDPDDPNAGWLVFKALPGQLDIRLLESSAGQIVIYDLQGRVIRTEKIGSESKVSTELLTPGIYIARIQAGGKVFAARFSR